LPFGRLVSSTRQGEHADIVAVPPRFRSTDGERFAAIGYSASLLRRAMAVTLTRNGTTKKGAAVAGGSKVKQGGVKQSGQEPLNVQKMDNASNEGESLITA